MVDGAGPIDYTRATTVSVRFYVTKFNSFSLQVSTFLLLFLYPS